MATAAVTHTSLGPATAVVVLRGDVEESDVLVLRHELTAALESGRTRFVVDLVGVGEIDVRAVRALHAAAIRAGRAEGGMAVACPDPTLQRVFAAHTDGLITLRTTVAGAIEALAEI